MYLGIYMIAWKIEISAYKCIVFSIKLLLNFGCVLYVHENINKTIKYATPIVQRFILIVCNYHVHIFAYAVC